MPFEAEDRYREAFSAQSPNSVLEDFLASGSGKYGHDQLRSLIELDARLCQESGYVITLERYLGVIPELRIYLDGSLSGHGHSEETDQAGDLVRTVLRCVLRAVDPDGSARGAVAGYLQMIRAGYPRMGAAIGEIYAELYGSAEDFPGSSSDQDTEEQAYSHISETTAPQVAATSWREGQLIRLGRYKIFESIGRGGAGVVHRATDTETGETVAVKIFFDLTIDLRTRERMCQEEHRSLQSLRYPGIVQTIDSGVAEGLTKTSVIPYLVLQYVEGARPISRYCDEHHLGMDARIKFFVDLCGVIVYAHNRNVMHGDLSTNNVLVDQYGKLHVIDFGLSGRLLQLTGSGVQDAAPVFWGGTRGFRDPNTYGRSELTNRSHWDIYSLGVILCVLLTGEQPFDLSGIEDEAQIVNTLIHSPPRISGAAPAELRAIILSAIRRSPEHRYGSVEELIADIRRYEYRQPVNAVKPTPRYQLQKFVGQHRVASAAFLLLLAVLLAGSIQGLRLFRQTRLDRDARRDLKSLLSVIGNHLATGGDSKRIPSKRFFSWLPEEDTPDRTACAVVLSYNEDQDANTLIVYDREGSERARVNQPLDVPPQVSQSYVYEPTPRIVGGLVADVLKEHPGDELVLLQQHRRMYPSVLRIYRLDRLNEPLKEIWHQGQWKSVNWNEDKRLLSMVAASNKLMDVEPGLGDWDGAWAREGERYAYPMVLLVIDPEELPERSGLAPIPPSDALPSTPAVGMYAFDHIQRPAGSEYFGIALRNAGAPRDGFTENGLVDLEVVYTRVTGDGYKEFSAKRTIDRNGNWLNAWKGQVQSPYQKGIELPERLHRIETDAIARVQRDLEGYFVNLHNPALVRDAIVSEGKELSDQADRVLRQRGSSVRWLYARAGSIGLRPDATMEEYTTAVALAERAQRLLPDDPRSGLEHSIHCVRLISLVRAHRAGDVGGEGVGDLLLRCEQLLAETEPGTLWEQRLQGFRAMLVLEQGDRENARAAFERMREISSDLGWIGTEHSMDEALVDEVNRLTTPN